MNRLMPCIRPVAEVEALGLPGIWLTETGPETFPVVTYGLDLPSTFQPLFDISADQLAAANQEALTNLAEEKVEIETIRSSALSLLMVSGSHFAAEKILDAEFMQALQEKLDAEMLLVGIPRRGLLLATAARPEDTTAITLFSRMVTREHRGERPVSDLKFVVQNGAIVGEVKVDAG